MLDNLIGILTPELLDALFPFGFLASADGRFRVVGRSLRKVIPWAVPGSDVRACLQVVSPEAAASHGAGPAPWDARPPARVPPRRPFRPGLRGARQVR